MLYETKLAGLTAVWFGAYLFWFAQIGNPTAVGALPVDAQKKRGILLRRINAFCARTGTPPTRFGAVVMGDTAFVGNLREGLDVRMSTYAKLMSWLDLHKEDQDPLPSPLRGLAKRLAALAVLRARRNVAASCKQAKKRGK